MCKCENFVIFCYFHESLYRKFFDCEKVILQKLFLDFAKLKVFVLDVYNVYLEYHGTVCSHIYERPWVEFPIRLFLKCVF